MRTSEIAIIGGGPAGLTAGIYSRRALRDTILFERELLGGQLSLTDSIENYPGIAKITGYDLTEMMSHQVQDLGLEIIYEEIKEIVQNKTRFLVKSDRGQYQVKSIIIATGAKPLTLKVKGEDRLRGKGVSYCATCDGPLFSGKDVAVVGGGDTAFTETLYLSKLAKTIHLIHRREGFRAEKIYIEHVKSKSNVQFVLNSIVDEIHGTDKVVSVSVRNVKDNTLSNIRLDGIFIAVGRIPNTAFIPLKDKDKLGYIQVNDEMETSTKGIFAAGDCTSYKWGQVVSAVGEAAKAAISSIKYIESFTEPV